MGAGNVKLVYARWGDLPHGPFRVLVYMALVSLDNDREPKFWGGREALAVALGRMIPDAVDEETSRERNAAFKAVRDATTLLTKRGAIEVSEAARPGQRQEWTLNLARLTVHENRAPVVHEKRAQWCTENVRTVHGNRAPEEEQEDPGLTTGVMRADLRDGGTGSARTRGDDGNDDSSAAAGPDKAACGTCGTMLDPGGACFRCRSAATWRTAS